MATQVQFRRGNTAQTNAFTGAVAEITVDTDKETVVVHDGSTAGGFPLARESALSANLAFTQAAFNLANTANVTAEAGFSKANSANVLAQSAFDKANVANTIADSGYAFANTVNIKVDSAYSFSNTVNIKTDAAFAFANTVNIKTDAAFTKANAANVLAQAAFDKANTANVTAEAGFAKANTANITAEAAFSKANSANVLAQSAFEKANNALANTGGSISGDLTITGNLTIVGQQVYANTQTVLIKDNIITLNAAIDQTSAPSANAGLEIDRGSSANVYLLWNENSDVWQFTNDGTTYYTIADTSTLSSAFNLANTANITAEAAFARANAANVLAQAAFNQANTANIKIDSGYAFANIVNIKVDSAFAFSNTVNIKTDAAFVQANAANVLAQAAFDKANSVTQQGFVTVAANGINVVADANNDTLTLSAADGVGITSNATTDTITINLTPTGVTSGTYGSASIVPVFVVDAQGRLSSATNTAISFPVTSVAGVTGAVSNTQLINGIIAVDGTGSGLDADLLDGLQGSSYANTTFTQAAFDKANVANVTAEAGFSKANSANVLAQAAFDKANQTAQLAFTTVSANGTSLIADANNDTLTITAAVANGIQILADATSDTLDIGLKPSGVTAGTYGNTSTAVTITIDQFGRITSVSQTAITAVETDPLALAYAIALG